MRTDPATEPMQVGVLEGEPSSLMQTEVETLGAPPAPPLPPPGLGDGGDDGGKIRGRCGCGCTGRGTGKKFIRYVPVRQSDKENEKCWYYYSLRPNRISCFGSDII